MERDVRGLEKLVLNLRLKDSTLHDTIQNQILEINRLMDIIRLEPEINQKGRKLLLETIDSLKLDNLHNIKKIETLEKEVSTVRASETLNFEKLVLLYAELTVAGNKINQLEINNNELENRSEERRVGKEC